MDMILFGRNKYTKTNLEHLHGNINYLKSSHFRFDCDFMNTGILYCQYGKLGSCDIDS